MPKTHVNPASLFASVEHGFSQVVIASGARTVFISGQTAWDANKRIVGRTCGEQARQALRNVKTAVEAASNILAFETRFRLAFVADLIGGACYVGVTVLLYVGTALSLNYLAPVLLLRGAQPLSAFETNQLQAEALIFFRLYRERYNVGMVFFGVQIVTIGYVIVQSTAASHDST
jgi:enamine deaminase RidA (YjgF/YER057c/UK114 family)